MALPRVVIVGGGFGGLFLAKSLARAPLAVTLIDRTNHHLFQPLLYQVATAGLSPSDISSPIRWILRRQRNVRVLLGDVVGVDRARRVTVLRDGTEIGYDWLAVATGASHSYFGHDDWAEVAPGLKTLDDAERIRRRVLLAFECAERADDPLERRRLLTFVIIGAGPTGVELAGALAEIARHALAKEFQRIDPRHTSIILLEGGPSIMTAFPEALRGRAEQALLKLGVLVRTGAKVTQIERGAVHIGEERIAAGTILWAAGVAASPLGRVLDAPLDRIGRVLVAPDLTVPGDPHVFVIGDLAAFMHQTGQPLPGVAPVAMQQARATARNIQRALEGQPHESFHYHDRGNLATIGRAQAIADLGWLTLWGYPAWLAWLFLHILLLQGFRNRVLVLFQWFWAYLTYQRSGRLVSGSCD